RVGRRQRRRRHVHQVQDVVVANRDLAVDLQHAAVPPPQLDRLFPERLVLARRPRHRRWPTPPPDNTSPIFVPPPPAPPLAGPSPGGHPGRPAPPASNAASTTAAAIAGATRKSNRLGTMWSAWSSSGRTMSASAWAANISVRNRMLRARESSNPRKTPGKTSEM